MALSPITSLSAYIKAIGKAYAYVATDPTTPASWSLLGVTEGDIVIDEKFQYNDYKLPEWTGDAIHLREIDGQDLSITLPLHWGDSTLYNKVAASGAKGGGRTKPVAVSTYCFALIPYGEVGVGLSYQGTPLVATPAAPTLGSGVSGILATATYYVVVTAVNAAGETIKSAEANVAVTGPNGSISVTPPAVAGATAFRAYYGTSTGAQNKVVQNAGTGAFLITGSNALDTGYNTPPAAARLLWSNGVSVPAEPVHAIWLHKATFEPGQYQLRHGEGGKTIRSIVVRPLFDDSKPEGQKLYTIGDPALQGITTYRV
jgi:hypothetical protein